MTTLPTVGQAVTDAGTSLGDHLEQRVRVAILFPIRARDGGDQGRHLYRRTLRQLIKAARTRWGGVTHSGTTRPLLLGAWFDEVRQEVVLDRHCLVIVDARASLDEVRQWLEQQKRSVLEAIVDELDLWIVVFHVGRVAYPYREKPGDALLTA